MIQSFEKRFFIILLLYILYSAFEDFFKLWLELDIELYAFRVLFIILFTILCFESIVIHKKKFAFLGVSAILILLFSVLIQIINPLLLQGNWVIMMGIGVIYYLAFIPLFFLIQSDYSKKKFKSIIFLILVLGTFFAIISLIQYAIGYPKYLSYMPYSQESFNLIGDQLHVGPLSLGVKPPIIWYILAAIASLFGIIQYIHKSYYSYIFTATLGINYIALLLSNVRTGIIIIHILLLAFFFIHRQDFAFLLNPKNRLRILLLILIFIIILFAGLQFMSVSTIERYTAFLSSPVDTLFDQRMHSFSCFLKNVQQYPFGIGPRGAGHINQAQFGYETLFYTNTRTRVCSGELYISRIGLELGIIGLIALVYLYIVLLYISFIIYQSKEKKNPLFTFSILTLLVFVLHFSFLPGEGPGYWMFWISSGLLFTFYSKNNISKPKTSSTLLGVSVFLIHHTSSIIQKSMFMRIFKNLLLLITQSAICKLVLKRK